MNIVCKAASNLVCTLSVFSLARAYVVLQFTLERLYVFLRLDQNALYELVMLSQDIVLLLQVIHTQLQVYHLQPLRIQLLVVELLVRLPLLLSLLQSLQQRHLVILEAAYGVDCLNIPG